MSDTAKLEMLVAAMLGVIKASGTEHSVSNRIMFELIADNLKKYGTNEFHAKEAYLFDYIVKQMKNER